MKNSLMCFPGRVLYLLPALLIIMSSCATAHGDESGGGLKDAYKDAFMIGTALNLRQINGTDVNGIRLTETHFNAITPENITKWEHIHPRPGEYNFEAADRFVEFGERNGMHMVGHTLVWHSQTPRWVYRDENGEFLDRDGLLERMRDHIHTVVGRYKGRFHAWDVVNEALNDDGTMRETHWYNIIGKDYLVKAFEYAREADPDAELLYNDYSLENPAKREGAIRLIRYLQENGAPVTGIGTQGHWHIPSPSLEEIEKTIVDFAALGIDVMVTELDIDVLPAAWGYSGADISRVAEMEDGLDPYTEGLPDDVQQELADRYREIFELFLKHRDAITRISFWGVTDGDNWKNNFPVRGRTNHPLLFDRDWQPKPAYHSVMEAANQR
jgi:endo-1,4-beta-xylanase